MKLPITLNLRGLLWTYVATWVQLLPGDTIPKWPLWPYVTTCDQVMPNLQYTEGGPKAQFGQYELMWPLLQYVINVTTCDYIIPNPCDHCDICEHVWLPVTRWYQTCKEPRETQKGNLSQPNLVSRNACGHCDHMWPPVTHSSYSSYPLQLLQLTTSVIPITNSSYPSYYKHPKFQPDHW